MAENETLDLGNRGNRRWVALCDQIGSGASAAEASKTVKDALVHLMKKLLSKNRLTGKPQIQLFELLSALNGDPKKLKEVLARADGHQYAHLLAEQRGCLSPVGAIEGMLMQSYEHFMDQIGLVKSTADRYSMTDFAIYRQKLAELARPEVRALAEKVAKNPTRPPRAEPRSPAEHAAARRAMLSESLVKRVRVGGGS